MLNPTEIKKFSTISSGRSLLALACDWALVAAIFAATAMGFEVCQALWQKALIFLVAIFLMGRTQLALAIVMHDGAHRRLFKDSVWNEWLGQLFCAAPLFFAMDSYKKLHLKHHLDPLVKEDPDLSLTGGYPISRASFTRKIIRDLTGVSYFKFIGYFLYQRKRLGGLASANRLPGQPSKQWVAATIGVAQLTIFGALWACGHPWLYLMLWILPFMTVLQFLLRIRGIAEHAGYQPNENQALNSRTIVNPLQTFFFAPHGVHYHIEHHLYPSVPFYRLREVHRLLKARGVLPERNFYTSYRQVIRELVI